MSKRERMNSVVAVFNSHINDASHRADEEFKKQFGEKVFEKQIAPYHKRGIMSILSPLNRFKLVWIVLVTAFVNEPLNKKLTDKGMKR